jgi:hypothetical protein
MARGPPPAAPPGGARAFGASGVALPVRWRGRNPPRHGPRGDDWTLTLPGDHGGARYGYRAAGRWAPERGLWFDPAKLLVDPHAVELDRRFAYDPALSTFGVDGAAGARAIVPGPLPLVPPAPPVFAPGG